MQLMTSEEAWRLSTARNSSPVDVAFCEDLVQELSEYVFRISPEVRNVNMRVVSIMFRPVKLDVLWWKQDRDIGLTRFSLVLLLTQAHLLSDERLYVLVARCQKAWPGLKAAAGKMISEDACGTLLPRILQCDEGMERAFAKLRALLTSRGYIGDPS